MKLSAIILCLGLAGAAVLATPATAPADVHSPTLFALADVDGDPSEWDLVVDFFANMHRAGQADKPLESKVYLRYDCLTQTLYALVLAEPGIPCLTDAGTAWIAINNQSNKQVSDSSGDDGVAPDFAWIGLGFDGDNTHAQGYEASFPLAPGSYEIIVHVNVFDDDKEQTSGTIGFPSDGPTIRIVCNPVATESSTWSAIKSILR